MDSESVLKLYCQKNAENAYVHQILQIAPRDGEIILFFNTVATHLLLPEPPSSGRERPDICQENV